MKIVIDLELSRRQKQVIRGAVVVGAVVAALGIGVAIADPLAFSTSESLSSTKMNNNFTDLNTRLHTVEATLAHATADGGYSLGATYCGETAPADGTLSALSGSGYAKARTACQALGTCSATAHMCTGEELTRSVAIGDVPGTGWYATAVYAQAAGVATRDCLGWKTNTSSDEGAIWDGNNGPSGVAVCATSEAVLCCN